MAGTVPLSGQIEPKSFPFLVADLHRNGATGSLKVEGPTYQKALYFRSGRVLFGSSNDPRDQLGAILIEEGRITPEQLEDVNSKVGPGNPLAKVLAETGFVSQRELSDAARAKVERIFSDVIGYTSGTFEFEDGVLPKGAVDLKLSTERLILTAVRRITDRTFVLRHLDGLDVVLRPAADLAAVRPEIESETGGLLAQLDGISTLKEAAGRTRLDDFEAAKVACALLFLGAVERVGPGGAPGPELDLAETAREAFGDEWTAPEPPPPPPRRRVGDDTIIAWGKIDPQAFMAADERAPAKAAAAAVQTLEPEPAAAAPATPEPGPELMIEPEPPRGEAVPDLPPAIVAPPVPEPPVPVPAVPEPPVPVPPRPERRTQERRAPEAARPEPAGATPAPVVRESPPPRPQAIEAPAQPPAPPPEPAATTPAARIWTPPAARRAAPPPERATKRPSKDDMAAVDALLNAHKIEGPLAPLERMPEARWTPPARSLRARRSGPPSWQRWGLLAGFVALAVLGFAGVWYFLKKPSGAARARPSPPPTTMAALPMTPPPASTLPPAGSTAVPRPLPTAAAAGAASVGSATTGAGAARDLLKRGDLPAAAQGFASYLRTVPAGSASIQLLVACSPETVEKAITAVGPGEIVIVPVKFQGRDCFRLCWGLYPSAAAASAARSSLPDYFARGGASPRVMTRAELVP